MSDKIRTNEGAVQYDHTMSHALEFFSKAGSLYSKNSHKKKSFYSNEANIVDLFKKVWYSGNYEIALKLLFWVRDCRGGAGNRSGFRDCLRWLAENAPDYVNANINLLTEYGRYDDLKTLFNTNCEAAAVEIWGKAIARKEHLACKWADRKDKPLLKYAKNVIRNVKDIGDFRRLLAIGRKGIVEQQMCKKIYNEIDYSKVPSKAMANYTNAFTKNDERRFSAFKAALEDGTAKINASVLFPHDCARTALNGDGTIANEQFKALPNYMEEAKMRIMTLCDSSGSMSSNIGGSVQAIHVSTALSLYCSDRLGKDHPFYRKFMEFCDESKLKSWTDKTFSGCYNNFNSYYREGFFNGSVGSTRIDKALDTLLDHAKLWNVQADQMINCVLILSDMQFTQGTRCSGTEVNNCLDKWEAAGYDRPKVIYWNLAGYAGSPETIKAKDVGLVSGFSPSILKAIFSGDDFTPLGIMNRAIDKYKVNVPK